MGEESQSNFLRARRALEFVSAALFLMAVFRTLPSSLPFLGTGLDEAKGKSLLWMFIAVWFYLFIRYWIAVRVKVTANNINAQGALSQMRKIYRRERSYCLTRLAKEIVLPETASKFISELPKGNIKSLQPKHDDGQNVKVEDGNALVAIEIYVEGQNTASHGEASIPYNWGTRRRVAMRILWRVVTHHDDFWEVVLPFIVAFAWIPFFAYAAACNPSRWIIFVN